MSSRPWLKSGSLGTDTFSVTRWLEAPIGPLQMIGRLPHFAVRCASNAAQNPLAVGQALSSSALDQPPGSLPPSPIFSRLRRLSSLNAPVDPFTSIISSLELFDLELTLLLILNAIYI